MRSSFHPALLLASALILPNLQALDAQVRTREPEVRIERLPGGVTFSFGGSTRAVLGVTMAEAGRADTAGVKIDEVRADGPAARAGLKAGDLITEVNGVSLRVSAADAADPALTGTAQRRLQRALARANAGDEVELRVQSGGASRQVRVKTVSAADLDGVGERRVGQGSMRTDRDPPVIGLSLGASGSIRDTLGLFISSVVAKGPAELAGIVEGERIASVNGIDVRVPREDVEDMASAEARVNRFVREVQKGEAGATVTLRVHGGGHYRDVSVKTVRGSTLPSRSFNISIGDGAGPIRLMTPSMGGLMSPRTPDGMRLRVPPDSPDAPAAPGEPRIIIRERTGERPQVFDLDGGRSGQIRIDGGSITIDREAIQRAMDDMRRNLQDMGRDMRWRIRDEVDAAVTSMPRVRVLPRRTVTIL